jgi:hypothetical protein
MPTTIDEPTAAVEHDAFGIGPAVYPVATFSATDLALLRRADPTLFLIGDYLRTAISTYVGAAFAEAWNKVRADRPGTVVVQSFVPFDPGPVLTQDQFKFPLLAVFREGGKEVTRTIEFDRLESKFGVAWILPPLRPSDMELLLPFRHAVAQAVRENLSRGWDSSYAGGDPIFDDVLELVGFAEVEYANAPGVGDSKLRFPTTMITLDVWERQERPLPGQYAAIDGVDASIDLVSSDGSSQPVYDFNGVIESTSGFDSGFSSGFR